MGRPADTSSQLLSYCLYLQHDDHNWRCLQQAWAQQSCQRSHIVPCICSKMKLLSVQQPPVLSCAPAAGEALQ